MRGPRPPSVQQLAAGATTRIRERFLRLREELLGIPGLSEQVEYDELNRSFSPTYRSRQGEVLRLHLDPVLAATVTLDAGPRQLRELLHSPALDQEARSRAIKNARRSGNRVFLAFLVRNAAESASLLSVLRVRLGE